MKDVINTKRFRRERLCASDVVSAVHQNDKQRFELRWLTSPDEPYCEEGPIGLQLFVRALQGHSIASTNDAELLQRLGEADLPKTAENSGSWNVLRFLSKHRRERVVARRTKQVPQTYTFCFRVAATAARIRDAKHPADLGLRYDLHAAAKAGAVFHRSRNDVVLTEGINGALSANHLKSIHLISSGETLPCGA